MVKKRVLLNASPLATMEIEAVKSCGNRIIPGDDFLAKVCRRWESESVKAQAYGVRVVLLRTGIVLGKKGRCSKKK
jgi:NAD dependent epimerase/dehydratase family enzyme